MRRLLRDNALSLTALLLFLLAMVGQSVTGRMDYNDEQEDHGGRPVGYLEYLRTGHFVEATFENWESEFLQMATFIFLTAFLAQRGAADAREPGGKDEPQDEDPRLHRGDPEAPWPVRRGGLTLKVYENSLTLALFLLFLASFALHAAGGAKEYSQEEAQHGGQAVSMLGYMATPRFWFESFQNWQSEFLSVFSLVVLSVFLRQRRSPESKPVHAPHAKTGSD